MKLSCLRQLNNVFTVDISASSLDPTKGKGIYIYIYGFDPPTAMVADLLCVFHYVTQEQTQALAGGGGGGVTSYTHFLVRKRYAGVTCLVS